MTDKTRAQLRTEAFTLKRRDEELSASGRRHHGESKAAWRSRRKVIEAKRDELRLARMQNEAECVRRFGVSWFGGTELIRRGDQETMLAAIAPERQVEPVEPVTQAAYAATPDEQAEARATAEAFRARADAEAEARADALMAALADRFGAKLAEVRANNGTKAAGPSVGEHDLRQPVVRATDAQPEERPR